MKYQLGDRVLLLHSNEEGQIVEIISDKVVVVDVDGVKFPAYTDQIDFPYFKRFSEKKKPAPKARQYIDSLKIEKSSARYKVEDGVWLAFLPVYNKDIFDDDVVENLKIYLVNQTKENLRFVYALRYSGDKDIELKNEIPSLSDFYLHDIPFEKLNDSPRFDFEFSLAEPRKGMTDYFESSLKLRPKQIFQKIGELKEKQQAHFSYLLFKEYPEMTTPEKFDLGKLSASGYHVVEASKFRARAEPARTVVDLHIEKLTDKPESLSNLEKLDLQLRTFEKFYELAVFHHLPMMIVVHGVGSGKLRDEIHDVLRLKKEVKSFVNQYHPSFGYGATEIYFQY